MQTIFSVNELAERWGLAPASIRRMEQEGTLHRLLTVVVMTGKFLYDETRDPGERYRPIRCTKNQYFTLADD